MSEIIISNKHGVPTASSLEVAENFGKRHDHVVRDIEKLIALEKEVSPKLGTPPLFFEAVYQHPQNKQYYKYYEMTRDGFALLAMGFTGKKAYVWKRKYIALFNEMEQKMNLLTYQKEYGRIEDKERMFLYEQMKNFALQSEAIHNCNNALNRIDYSITQLSDVVKCFLQENFRNEERHMQYEKYDLEEVKKNCLLPYVEAVTTQSKHASKNQYICPLCGSGTGKDGTGAFTVYPESDSWFCFVCKRGGSVIDLYLEMNNMNRDSKADIAKARDELGAMFHLIPKRPAEVVSSRSHVYTDKDGNILGKKDITKYSDGSKRPYWSLYHPETGAFTNGLSGTAMPLYHADRLHNTQGTVYFVEGEKDVETLERYYGFIATSTPNGGGQVNWLDLYNADLSGREIIIITDNDDAGEKYGQSVAKNLYKITKSIKIIPTKSIWPECPQKADISDAIEALGADEVIQRLANAIQKAENYKPESDKITPEKSGRLQPWNSVKEMPKKVNEEVPFPKDVFPYFIEGFIDNACENIQVDRAMIACAVLAVSALACQGRFVIAHPSGNGYTENLPLFIAICANPGERKSSSLKVCYEPIKKYIETATALYDKETADFNAKLASIISQAEQTKKVFSKKNLSAQEKQDAMDDLKDLELQKITLERKRPCSPNIILDDATPEALLNRMQATGGNAGIFTAESDFISTLAGMYNGGGTTNLSILLKAYDRESYSCDRVTRGQITIPSPTLSICAFVQPALYTELINNEHFRGRGLSGRFMLAKPSSHAALIDHGHSKRIDSTMQACYSDTIEKIMKHELSSDPPVIQWEDDARAIAIEYMNKIQRTLAPGGSMEDNAEYAAKAAGRFIRICGILYLLESEAEPHTDVEKRVVENAIKIHDYFFRQSEIAMAEADNHEEQALAIIESALIELTDKGKTSVTAGNLWDRIRKKRINGKSAFSGRENFNSYVDQLEENEKIQVITTGKRKDIYANPYWIESKCK